MSGLRVNFRAGIDYAACNGTDYSVCDTFAMLNHLDGFDLQPRVTVPLTGAVKLSSVDDSNFYITDAAGAFVSGLRQLVFDPAANTLSGISDQFLTEDTPYRVVVTDGIQDSAGNPITACSATCTVPFTTRTASSELVESAGRWTCRSATAQRLPAGPFPNAATGTSGRKAHLRPNTVFHASSGEPSAVEPAPAQRHRAQRPGERRPGAPAHLQRGAEPDPPGHRGLLRVRQLPLAALPVRVGVGAPDRPYTVATGTPTARSRRFPPRRPRRHSAPTGSALIVVTPDPAKFAPPWPVAIYGPGFTRSNYDIFVTADYNAELGIATMATDPSGHGYGPNSTTTITS